MTRFISANRYHAFIGNDSNVYLMQYNNNCEDLFTEWQIVNELCNIISISNFDDKTKYDCYGCSFIERHDKFLYMSSDGDVGIYSILTKDNQKIETPEPIIFAFIYSEAFYLISTNTVYILSYQDFINNKKIYSNYYIKLTVDCSDTIKDYIVYNSPDHVSYLILVTHNGKLFRSYINYCSIFRLCDTKFIYDDLHVDNIYVRNHTYRKYNDIVIKTSGNEYYKCKLDTDVEFTIMKKISFDIEFDAYVYDHIIYNDEDYTPFELSNRKNKLILKCDLKYYLNDTIYMPPGVTCVLNENISRNIKSARMT